MGFADNIYTASAGMFSSGSPAAHSSETCEVLDTSFDGIGTPFIPIPEPDQSHDSLVSAKCQFQRFVLHEIADRIPHGVGSYIWHAKHWSGMRRHGQHGLPTDA